MFIRFLFFSLVLISSANYAMEEATKSKACSPARLRFAKKNGISASMHRDTRELQALLNRGYTRKECEVMFQEREEEQKVEETNTIVSNFAELNLTNQ
jgi:hypothetical protein